MNVESIHMNGPCWCLGVVFVILLVSWASTLRVRRDTRDRHSALGGG
ncbi:unnamed protein product [Amoebophrya sp. A25]|nr:unnamed protein product [Amoebophrya sp. A25]|eukprot:GSA25T00021404001.1